jgi:hypothetical protein
VAQSKLFGFEKENRKTGQAICEFDARGVSGEYETQPQSILHCSFYIFHLSLKKRDEPNEK